MATQPEYTAVANALVKLINDTIDGLSPFDQGMIRQYLSAGKISAGAGAAAKTAVDTLDEFRALEKSGAIL